LGEEDQLDSPLWNIVRTDAPTRAQPGERFDVVATVANRGTRAGTTTVELGGKARQISLGPGERKDVTFSFEQTPNLTTLRAYLGGKFKDAVNISTYQPETTRSGQGGSQRDESSPVTVRSPSDLLSTGGRFGLDTHRRFQLRQRLRSGDIEAVRFFPNDPNLLFRTIEGDTRSRGDGRGTSGSDSSLGKKALVAGAVALGGLVLLGGGR
jgi:hypothetical protein